MAAAEDQNSLVHSSQNTVENVITAKCVPAAVVSLKMAWKNERSPEEALYETSSYKSHRDDIEEVKRRPTELERTFNSICTMDGYKNNSQPSNESSMVTLAYKPQGTGEDRSSQGSMRSSSSGSLRASAHASRDRLSLSSFALKDINEAEELRLGPRVEVPKFEYLKFGMWPEMNFTQQIEMRKEL